MYENSQYNDWNIYLNILYMYIYMYFPSFNHCNLNFITLSGEYLRKKEKMINKKRNSTSYGG